MPNGHHPDCTSLHVNWAAWLTIITVLCALFAFGGYLLSDRTSISSSIVNLTDRVSTLEKKMDNFEVSHNTIVLPSLSRIEQSLEDIDKRIDDIQQQERADHPRQARMRPVSSLLSAAPQSLAQAYDPPADKPKADKPVPKARQKHIIKVELPKS
jgi:predicted PurR-regulated permease PerM